MLEVPDVAFIRRCGVVVFALHLDLCCGECYFGYLQFECVPPIYVSVCFVPHQTICSIVPPITSVSFTIYCSATQIYIPKMLATHQRNDYIKNYRITFFK